MNLDAPKVTRLTRPERFHSGDERLDFDLLQFWEWAGTTSTATLSEGEAVGGDGDVRTEWAAFDAADERARRESAGPQVDCVVVLAEVGPDEGRVRGIGGCSQSSSCIQFGGR